MYRFNSPRISDPPSERRNAIQQLRRLSELDTVKTMIKDIVIKKISTHDENNNSVITETDMDELKSDMTNISYLTNETASVNDVKIDIDEVSSDSDKESDLEEFIQLYIKNSN